MSRPEGRDDILRLNGMVNYLSRFLSDVKKPLRDLTHKDAVWCWDDPQETAWNDVKCLIVSAPVLAYYKPTEVLEIQCDSIQSRLRAALMQNGHPIAYASRAFTETESRYAQIEKKKCWQLLSQWRSSIITRSVEKPLSTLTTSLYNRWSRSRYIVPQRGCKE